MRRPALLFAGGLVAVLVVAALVVPSGRRGARAPEREVAREEAERAPSGSLALPGSAETAEAVPQRSEELPSVELPRPGKTPPPVGLRAIVEALAAELGPDGFRPVAYERHLGAAVEPLVPSAEDAAATLLLLADEPETGVRWRAAALELVRELQSRARRHLGPAPPVALQLLRRETSCADPELAPMVATRALAVFGDALDRADLLARSLARPRPARYRHLSAVAHATDPEVAFGLAAESDVDSILALDTFEEESGWVLDDEDRDHVAATLAARLRDPSLEQEVRLRTLDALLSWSPVLAERALVDLALDPAESRDLTRRALERLDPEHDPAQARRLAEALGQTSGPLRLELALALGPATRADPTAPGAAEVEAVLLGAVEDGADPADRRRVLVPLARSGSPVARAAVERIALSDADAGMRSAAVRALGDAGTAGDEGLRTLLSSIAEEDRNAAVRAVAEDVLSRLGP